MPTEKKIREVEELTDALNRSSVIIGADYRGLRVDETTALRRTLREAGMSMHVVKNTLFLRAVHAACAWPLVRRVSAKVDALATMIEHERTTYERWLAMPDAIDARLVEHFDVVYRRVGWGKLMFVGRSRGG